MRKKSIVSSPEFIQERIERFIYLVKARKEAEVVVTNKHFVIIDVKLVWHGGMNLLSKEGAWDNLMRIKSDQVAAELLEIALKNQENIKKG